MATLSRRKATTTTTRVTLPEYPKEDTYVRSYGGISTEWDDWYSIQEYCKKLVNVRGMI